MKCLLIFFICLGLTSAQYDAWYKECRAGLRPVIADFQCGIIKDTQNRIRDGTVAERNDIPWMAQVVIDPPDYKATVRQGAIIGPYHILTLGSMFESGIGYKSIDDITVKVNKLWKNQSIEDGEVHHKVKCLSTYPGYDGLTKDYAILILKEPIMSYLATPVCLPSKDGNGNYPTFAGSVMTVSGWGFTTHKSDDLYYSKVLKRAQVKGISHQQCHTKLDGKYIYKNWVASRLRVNEFMLCANPIDGQACNADFGGPLTFYNDTHHVLAGLARSNFCNQRNEPTIYSRVTMVIDWIERHGLYTGKPVCPK